jgi:hypothetical protein
MVFKKSLFGILLFFSCFVYSQNFEIDTRKVDSILTIKNKMMKDHKIKSFYTIQLFSGKKENAIEVREKYYEKEYPYNVTIEFETPNYKVWVGKFRTKLEADKTYDQLKEDYPYALIFMPGR